MKITLILIALSILLLGCINNSAEPNITTNSSNSDFLNATNYTAQNTQTELENQELNQLKTQLQTALKSGGINPNTYDEINTKISQFERQNYDKNTTSKLRELLSQLTIGGKENNTNTSTQKSVQITNESTTTTWQFENNEKWTPNTNPPKCPEPLTFKSPVDLKLVSAILYPGQVRGGDFKPHGGFRTDGANQAIQVTAPLEGYIVSAAKFYDEFGVNYMFDIQHPCGIMYRFGHLGAVPPKLEAIFNDIPMPEKGDSRTHQVKPFYVKLGEVIATDTQHGPGFDWGVYDLRKENKAAQDATFRTLHRDEPGQAYYALCWFDYLSPADKSIVMNLPAADGKSGSQSDYC